MLQITAGRAKRTLDKFGIPRATFYRWDDRYREGSIEAISLLPMPTHGDSALDCQSTSHRDFRNFFVLSSLSATIWTGVKKRYVRETVSSSCGPSIAS
jgi:hypothetical protein